MLITNHVLAGALVGNSLAPLPAGVVGFVSHLAMDNLPHFGIGGELDIALARKDGVIGLLGIAYCTALARPQRRFAVLAGIFGACLPDTDKLGEYFFGFSPWPPAFDRFHKWIQREAPTRMPVEVLSALGLALVVAERLRREA